MLETILPYFSYTEWKKKKEILEELDNTIGERQLRILIAENNKLFGEGKSDSYIAHSSKGYKKTMNWDEMKKSIADNRKRAITMLVECQRAEKAFQHRNYLKTEELLEEDVIEGQMTINDYFND